jgi:3-phosphoglycerate kinase
MNLCNSILIGGGMAYTFLAAKGIGIGRSLSEPDKVHTAKRIIERAETRNIPILLPLDHVIASVCDASATPKTTSGVAIPDDMMGLDIGPKTISKFSESILNSKTIFWNGPMGVFELEPFSNGTMTIARTIAESRASSVVGGGDSITALKKAKVEGKIGHVSTGGGASLEFIEGKKLPGIAALEE